MSRQYDEAVRALLALGKELAAPRHARVQKFDLENIRVLAERLGAPHRALPCVHIAGTNGKGSTAAMLESILRAAGFSTGLFTSPHLERINERIRFNGEPIADDDFAREFARIREAIEALLANGELAAHPTYFECLTAMAMSAFARRRVDIAVYEVGLGGRLDSTNIIQPEVAVITQIDFDHENFLGHSIAEIASEKAGIIKPGVPVVSAAERPEACAVIVRRAAEMKAPLTEINALWQTQIESTEGGFYRVRATAADDVCTLRLEIPLRGKFQVRNALAAATAARLLRSSGFSISDQAIERGVASSRWPGRFEMLSSNPAVFLDGGHNPAAAREIYNFWREHLSGKRIFLVYGAMRDKAVDEIAGLLFPPAEHVFLTAPRQSRAISAPQLAEMTSHLSRGASVVADSAKALEAALSAARQNDVVFVAGSLYLVGEVREYWKRRLAAQVPAKAL